MAETKLRHPEGSTIIIAIGIVAILMTISLAIAAVALVALRSTRQISQANQAYFAAETGVEEAIYQMAGHDLGFESSSVNPVGDKIDESDDRSPLADWEITNRTKEVSLDEDPSVPVGGGTEDLMLLSRGSTITVGLYFDTSTPYAPLITREQLTKVELTLQGNDEDLIDLNTALPNDIRVTELLLFNLDDVLFSYPEDTRVVAGDLDEGTELTDLTLSFVDFNQDNIWSKREPVYFDTNASGGDVEAGDIRVNTISPDYVTCTELYAPSLDVNDMEVIDGQCDTITALLNIDNDQDGEVDEDPMNFIDDDGDGFIDEDPASWPLSEAFFFVDDSDCALNIQACLETREIGNPSQTNVNVYADTTAVSYTITAVNPDTAEERIIVNLPITKTTLRDEPSMTFTEPQLAASLADILSPYTDEIKLNLFAVLKGVKFRIKDPIAGTTMLAKLKARIRAIGKSGPFRQTLESVIQQVETVPIFNYTITY